MYDKAVSFAWDERKALLNLKKHKVTFEEAVTVFFSKVTIIIEDHRHNEMRFVVIGFSTKTNLLTVCYSHQYEDEIRIISVRRATKKEEGDYEKRIRFL